MKNSIESIFDNAVDFLDKSLEEFKETPKFSVLHFAIAVELFLKARLAAEHWSLIVHKNAKKSNYLKGEFNSVNLDEAIKRLRDIVGEPISDAQSSSFNNLAAHRNKIIHFFHGELISDRDNPELQKIIKEQCECWYHLKILISKRWRAYFKERLMRFESLDWKMRRHSEYLSAIFDRMRSKIETQKANGKNIEKCNYCNFKAVPMESEYENLSMGS